MKNMVIAMMLVMYFMLVVIWYGWEGIWKSFMIMILIYIALWWLAMILRFIIWIMEWPRRRNIRILFPLQAVLTDRQAQFLAQDLRKRKISLKVMMMREKAPFYLEHAAKEINQVEQILERLRFCKVTPEDISILNHLYGFPDTEDAQNVIRA